MDPSKIRTVQRDAISELSQSAGPAAAFVTTEHFNLQTARAVTVSEANGRAAMYLAALSSNLIALAFIGQVSQLGKAFYAFALVLLPVLALIGLVTFLRLVQSSLEDIAYAERIGLLRSYYLRAAPELEPYLVVARQAPPAPTRSDVAASTGPRQLMLTVAGMVAMVNSVVVASCAGLALAAASVHPVVIPVAIGAVIGLGVYSLHERHHRIASNTHRPDATDRIAISTAPPRAADSAMPNR